MSHQSVRWKEENQHSGRLVFHLLWGWKNTTSLCLLDLRFFITISQSLSQVTTKEVIKFQMVCEGSFIVTDSDIVLFGPVVVINHLVTGVLQPPQSSHGWPQKEG